MMSRFGTPSRCSATGVTTASILAVVLAMAVSTLFEDNVPLPNTAMTAGHTEVAQTQRPTWSKKS